MKNIYVTFLQLLLMGSLFAQAPQITNSGFEQWTNAKKANGWTSTNDVLGPISGGTFQNVYKDSTTKKQNYSIRLKCVSLLGTAIPGAITNGSYPTSGISNSFNPNLIRPVRWIYSERPDSITGYYKYTKQGNDTGTVGIRFFKNQNIIGEGVFWALSSNSNLQRFSSPINWYTSETPDSMYIVASTGGISSNTDGSELILDNLGFAGLTGIKSISNSSFLVLTPNPAKQNFKIKNLNGKTAQVTIYNSLGAVVLKTQTASGLIDIENLNPGLYFTEIIQEKERSLLRLVKE